MELPVDIIKRVKLDFNDDSDKAINNLRMFQNRLEGPYLRILRSAIKNASGNLKQLKFELNSANIDWRDTISIAEEFSFECENPFEFKD